MTTTTVIYSIEHPANWHATIEVYGDPEMGWYEWRITEGGQTLKDTGKGEGQGYGQAAIALRDALIYATDESNAG